MPGITAHIKLQILFSHTHLNINLKVGYLNSQGERKLDTWCELCAESTYCVSLFSNKHALCSQEK